MVLASDLWEYLREPADDESKLKPYLTAALSKARAAGIPQYENNALYDMFILNLASLYYESRNMSAEPQAQRMIDNFTLSLRHAGEDG